MTKITIYHKDPVEIIEIVRKLREEGLLQGTDFDFAYNQSRWDGMIGELPKHTDFMFYQDKHATLFALKYS